MTCSALLRLVSAVARSDGQKRPRLPPLDARRLPAPSVACSSLVYLGHAPSIARPGPEPVKMGRLRPTLARCSAELGRFWQRQRAMQHSRAPPGGGTMHYVERSSAIMDPPSRVAQIWPTSGQICAPSVGPRPQHHSEATPKTPRRRPPTTPGRKSSTPRLRHQDRALARARVRRLERSRTGPSRMARILREFRGSTNVDARRDIWGCPLRGGHEVTTSQHMSDFRPLLVGRTLQSLSMGCLLSVGCRL